MHFSTLAFPLWAALTLVHAAPSVSAPEGLKAPLEGYTVQPIQWDVEVTPGGRKVKLTGTVEKVVAELKLKNPKWESDFNITSAVDIHQSTEDDIAKLAKRQEWVTIQCNMRAEWQWATYNPAIDAVRYLRGLSGRPSNGPRTCGRVSCSYGTSVWWCNDNNYVKTLNSWREIGDGALAVTDRCSPLFVTQFSGQVFERYGWNTIVRGERC